MAAKYRLAGRGFNPTGESTFEHSLRFGGLMHRAGMDAPAMKPGETPEDFARRLLGELADSGLACEMLGCLLIPEGVSSDDWTPEIGHETAQHIAHLKAAPDLALARSLLLSLVIDFFESGLATSVTSPTSSGQPANQIETNAMVPGAV